MKNLVFIGIIFVMLFSACEKDIDLVMPEYTPSIMIEGMIMNDRSPIVLLTNNIPYETNIGYQIYENSFIHNANVTITGPDNIAHALAEITNTDPVKGFKSYFYSSTNFVGKIGEKYMLTVKIGNKTYTSQTTIPDLVPIKDIWIENHPDKNNETLKLVKIRIADPIQKNYYRYSSEINGLDVAAPEISTVNDAFFNGSEYTKAIDSGLKNEDQDIHGEISGYFSVGDTITVNWSNVDKPYYDFWTTVDFKRTQNKNPFLNPTRIVGNIAGCLGYWGGMCIDSKKVIVK